MAVDLQVNGFQLNALGRGLLQLLLLASLCATIAGCLVTDRPQQPRPTDTGKGIATGLFTDADGNVRRVAPAALSYTGEGSYQWPDGRRYQGDWMTGTPNGTGSLHYPDGSGYQGEWQAGLYHGTGSLILADGTRYQGGFSAGSRAGTGAQLSDDGRYEGQWQNDQPHGTGTFAGADGSVYSGQYQQGDRHGSGRFASATGSVYEGDWINDEPSGFGVLLEADGGRREGQWLAGSSNGYGTFEHPAGLRYSGNWKDDQQAGFGAEERPDGSRYEGDWLAGKPHGKGTASYADGSSHSGLWLKGQPSGAGTREDPAGYTLSGEWHQGALTSGTLTLTNVVQNASFTGELLNHAGGPWTDATQQWLKGHSKSDVAAAAWLLAVPLLDARELTPQAWLERAAAGNIAWAQYELGKLLLDQDVRAAVQWLNKAANGDPNCGGAAHFLLGSLYHFGELLPQDEDQAESHYVAAIERGSLMARRNLSVMLATTSISYVRDSERAIALLEPVANLYQRPGMLDALAVVYHASGRSADAVQTQLNALAALAAQQPASAEQAGQAAIRADMQRRLEQYRQSAPQ